MDFLYADLNEVVDPFIYTTKGGDGTIDLQIDNESRTIDARLIRTPKKLSLLVDGVLHQFDGSQDNSVEIKHREYILKKVDGGSGDTRATYSLLVKDHTTGEFSQIEGSDLLYIEDSASILNIENGSITGQISSKEGVGYSGLTSVNYKKKDQSWLYMDSFGNPTNVDHQGNYIIGTRNGQTLYGGLTTGTQSMAFGGQAYGMAHQNTLVVTQLDKATQQVICTKIFNVIQQDPIVVVLESNHAITDTTYTISEISGSINIVMEDGLLVPLIVERRRGQFNRIYPTTAMESYIKVQQVRNVTGVVEPTTANGHQSISLGGSTHADANWSQAFGLGTRSNSNCQMVIGKFNQQEQGAAFTIGNGSYDAITGDITKSNALSIMFDGSVKVYDEDSPTKYRVGKIALKEELEEAIGGSIVEMQAIIATLLERVDQAQESIDGIKNDLKSIGYTEEDTTGDGKAEFALDDGELN